MRTVKYEPIETTYRGSPTKVTKSDDDNALSITVNGETAKEWYASQVERDVKYVELVKEMKDRSNGYCVLPPDTSDIDTDDRWERVMITSRPRFVRVSKFSTAEKPIWSLQIDDFEITYHDEERFQQAYQVLTSYIRACVETNTLT